MKSWRRLGRDISGAIISIQVRKSFPVLKSIQPESNQAVHSGEQSVVEAEYCIRHLTEPGAVILDPMMGSGTTGIAALKLGRDFIGIEKDPETLEIAKGRIAQALEGFSGAND